MKKRILFAFFLLPVFAAAQKDSVLSGVYRWKEAAGKGKTVSSAVLFQGKVHDMEWLQMSSNKFQSSDARLNYTVPSDEENLLIVKEGSLKIKAEDTAYAVGAGSVALLLPGEKVLLQNADAQPCGYYLMKYRSKQPVDLERGKAAGGSLVIDWNKIEFKPHGKGGRRDFFERPTAMSKRLEMHVSTLHPGLKSHDPHRHRAEEIVLVTEGETEMQIGEKFYKGAAGSVYYLGSNVLHAVKSTGSKAATYFAFQFE